MSLNTDSDTLVNKTLRVLSGATAHLTAVTLTVYVTYVSRPGTSLFSWHPFLMTVAFLFLMTEAILIFSPDSSLLRSFTRRAKGRAHWILQLLSVICAVIGLVIIYSNKVLHEKPHFSTWHGLIGALTLSWALLQSVGGLTLMYPKLIQRWNLATRKLYHATAGLLGYLLGCTSLLLGMCSVWFSAHVTGISWYLCIMCPILTGLVIMNQVSNAYLYRKRSQS
ncbi:transmembrane reductase CYB561D2 [Bombina bombina]|uniref:transmembrane reductase CYB561D2 n=1 Tax=Bombina bombina TaxID=8345 RepID=UPI00235ACE84|nr:transmembrane reductase CYB561D2 [Bombina bombina]XP_053577088.1 transmembrane reductase CYB561D2 [Bombina bombina]XP_053577089.1 transmembrane reductase CYB561D2 [Bombina bombina]